MRSPAARFAIGGDPIDLFGSTEAGATISSPIFDAGGVQWPHQSIASRAYVLAAATSSYNQDVLIVGVRDAQVAGPVQLTVGMPPM